MERNNDELLAEMLRSIDQNTDTIRRQQAQLVKHNRVLDRHTRELDKHTIELTRQSGRNEEFFRDLKDQLNGIDAVQNNHLEMILHTTKLLDRIVKTNRLKI